MGPQLDALRRGVDVLVATPGRLIDHLERGSAKLDAGEMLVMPCARATSCISWISGLAVARSDGNTCVTMMPRALSPSALMKPLEALLDSVTMWLP